MSALEPTTDSLAEPVAEPPVRKGRTASGHRGSRTTSRPGRISPPVWFMLGLMLATGFTWVTGLAGVEYDEGPILGFAHTFPGPAADWDTSTELGSVTITKSRLIIERKNAARAFAIRTFRLTDDVRAGGGLLRVSGKVDTLRKPNYEEPDNIAAMLLWFVDGNGRAFNYLTVHALHGTQARYSGSRIVKAPDNARRIAVAMLTRDSDGKFALTDATVQQIATPLSARLVDLALAIIWGTLIVLAGLWMKRHASVKVSGMLLGLVVVTFIGVLMPETARMSILQPAYHWLASMLSVSGDRPLALSFKIGHFMVFFLVALTLLSNKAALGMRTWLVLSCMLLLGIATEGLQLHLFDRTTRLSDLYIDMAGVGLALLLVSSANWARRRHRSSFRTSNRTLVRMGLKPRHGGRSRHAHQSTPTSAAAPDEGEQADRP